ncbi:histidinol-phosphate transaminase [Sulfuriflexus sp.]|uniref:histidinol-phosphate transaminase n=1 Tax=Sulfuriflexus sp. TaxID=2015443 RepID=UPI0028CE0A02|nr:histidinol-phosphate transaminase [Sulfuriflexus sp.]MDT8404884.1 histidinol-phosphate transaminase [Sulfuriflexus sp.]
MSVSINELALPGVQKLRPYEPGKPVEELERELGITGIIKLASNENPLGPSPRVIEALQAQMPELARYPDGNAFQLKQALAAIHGVDLNQVTIGNGSNDILELIARAFVGTDNEVVFSEHAFAVYPIVTQAVGATAVVVPAKAWGHDLDAMAEAVTERTRVIFVANPNNPTGTCVGGDALKAFIRSIPVTALVVIDEAYFEYAQDLFAGYVSASEWLDEFPNLLVTRTFSKAYGLAGLRVGYGISSAEISDFLNRVRQPFNVNSMALAGALAALADKTHLAEGLRINREGLAQYEVAFETMGLDWIPTAGNFISVDLQCDGREVFNRLLHEGVITRAVDNYGMPSFLRITVGTADENTRCIEALKKVLAGVKKND